MGRKMILLFLMVFIIGVVSAEVYYEVEVSYNEGIVEIINVNPVYLRSQQFNFYSDSENVSSFLVELVGNSGNIVYSEKFSVSNFAIKHYGENGTITSGELVYFDKYNFTLYFPYFEDVNSIVIKDENGNDVEDLRSVSTYARVQNDLFDFGVPKDGMVEKENEQSNLLYYLLFIVMVAILIVVVLYFVLSRKKK